MQKIEMKLTKQNGTDVSRRQIQPSYKGFQKKKKKAFRSKTTYRISVSSTQQQTLTGVCYK